MDRDVDFHAAQHMSIAMFDSGLPRRWPAKTKSPRFDFCQLCRMATARVERGTRCWRPAFIRAAGTVQTSCRRSISSQRIPSSSPDRAAVRMQSSSATAANASRSRRLAMNAGTSSYGIAAWWPRVSLRAVATGDPRCPRQRAGFSPVPEPLRLGSIEDLFDPTANREAVSAFVVQIGFRTARTSSVDTVSTGLARRCGIGGERRFPLRLVLLISEARRQRGNDLVCHLTEGRDAAGTLALGDRVLSGLSDLRRAAAAFSLASDSVTLDALPRPISLACRAT